MELIKVLVLPFCFVSLSACSTLNKNSKSGDIKKDSKEEEIPKITKPNVKKIWIPEEIRNNGTEYVEGHYMYLIERNSTWSK
ncbi:MAG: hypothetical protein AABY64_14345 [Bdellovibrionota bacterium]|mgnify:CR=1 FL=1